MPSRASYRFDCGVGHFTNLVAHTLAGIAGLSKQQDQSRATEQPTEHRAKGLERQAVPSLSRLWLEENIKNIE